jgi:hypothetical protein
MHARRLLNLTVIAAFLPLTACTGDELVKSGTANWLTIAGRDLNCGQGPRLIGVEYQDITGDGDGDALVVMRCDDPEMNGDQLELFDGDKKVSDPPIAVLTRNWMDNPLTMEHGCVSIVGDQVIVRGWPLQPGPRKQKVWIWKKVGKKDRRLVLESVSDDDRTELLTTRCFNQK